MHDILKSMYFSKNRRRGTSAVRQRAKHPATGDGTVRPPLSAVAICTGFGAGFWPWGPGTAGSLLALAVWFALHAHLPFAALEATVTLLVVVFSALGITATRRLMPFWGSDPSRVVVDEMVGMWVALLAVPCWRQSPSEPSCWMWAVAALALFRFFDIVKPLGIRFIDSREGAFWVMADDVVAGLYAGAVMLIFHLFFT